MLNGDRSMLTSYPASTSFFATVGVTAERCSSGFDSARTCRVVGAIVTSQWVKNEEEGVAAKDKSQRCKDEFLGCMCA